MLADLADWQINFQQDLIRAIKGSSVRWPLREELDQHVLHLAVFVEPYLRWILQGRKTIDSRFSTRLVAPFGRIAPGDLLALKRSGGPVLGVCRVADVQFFEFAGTPWKEVLAPYAVAICADGDEFWSQRQRARYASVIQLSDVIALPGFVSKKKDRRGWVVFDSISPRRSQMPTGNRFGFVPARGDCPVSDGTADPPAT
jgi:hypothetical protein